MKQKFINLKLAKKYLIKNGETINHDKSLLKITNGLQNAEQYVDAESKDMGAKLVYASRINTAYSAIYTDLIETAIEQGYCDAKRIDEVYRSFRDLQNQLEQMTGEIIDNFSKIDK